MFWGLWGVQGGVCASGHKCVPERFSVCWRGEGELRVWV